MQPMDNKCIKVEVVLKVTKIIFFILQYVLSYQLVEQILALRSSLNQREH